MADNGFTTKRSTLTYWNTNERPASRGSNAEDKQVNKSQTQEQFTSTAMHSTQGERIVSQRVENQRRQR